MAEGDKAEDHAAADMSLCPVCQLGPVQMTRDRPDGGQEGMCQRHEPFVFLERDSEKEPWRKAPIQPDAPLR
jgi:hypothetical protein